MRIGRNDPCPCGSGKKYKKCCLQKDQTVAVILPPTDAAPETDEEPAEDNWEEAETSAEVNCEEVGDSADEPQRPLPRKYPRPDEHLPELAPEEQGIIKAWWNKTAPLFRKRDADCMLQRVETALTEFPSLFIHLGLHQEFLFELGGELGRLGRMPDYVALLKRIRREQRLMYSFCYGAYDSDVIAELVVTQQLDEIPAYFDLFKEYPDAQPDYCHEICNLLAWRGHAEPLYLLCEAVATPMLTSSEVISGGFALDWLIQREEIPFYQCGDLSSGALERTAEAITRLGDRLQFPLKPKMNLLRAGLQACLEPAQIETRGPFGDQAKRRLSLNFVSHLCRDGKIPWLQGFLLGDLLLDYFFWCRQQKVPWARLQKKDVESFAVYRSRQFFSVRGVTALAIIQGMVWFAEYLGTAVAISVPEVERIRKDCRQLFDAGRKAVEPTDPAYRICPTFEQLTMIAPLKSFRVEQATAAKTEACTQNPASQIKLGG
jgi:hypothetical protein